MAFPDVMAFRFMQGILSPESVWAGAAKWLSSSRTILSEFMAFIERFASSMDDPWAEAAKRPLKTHEFTKKYYAAGLAILLHQSGLATARVYAHSEWMKKVIN